MEKIQLLHPQGKNAFRIDKDKYDTMTTAIMSVLSDCDKITHSELLENITAYFSRNNIQFKGNINWHLESVKLDLEARKLIHRSKELPARYSMKPYELNY